MPQHSSISLYNDGLDFLLRVFGLLGSSLAGPSRSPLQLVRLTLVNRIDTTELNLRVSRTRTLTSSVIQLLRIPTCVHIRTSSLRPSIVSQRARLMLQLWTLTRERQAIAVAPCGRLSSVTVTFVAWFYS